MLNRAVELPARRSFFLFGPRQTGKSTLIRERWRGRRVWTVDLLHTDEFLRYAKEPSLLRLEAGQKLREEGVDTIFIDEVQKVPLLLDEVQAVLQEHPSCQFILTGSSARKLRRGAANLLAGRLVRRSLHPFTYAEAGAGFDIEETLRFGSLPAIHGKTGAERADILDSYAQTYLREEIQAEGLSRNVGGFSRFLDVAAAQCGELVNFSAVGRDAGLPTRTVQCYFDILEETLVGVQLPAWRRSVRKRLTAHPKVYLFDLGVTNGVNRRLGSPPDRMLRGRLFEQWVVLETFRHLAYFEPDCRMFYWRTGAGAEVDLLIERGGRLLAACEIKASRTVAGADIAGLRSFREEHPETALYLVSEVPHAHRRGGVQVLPWRLYLERLGKKTLWPRAG